MLHDDALPWPHTAHLVTDREDLGDALVTEAQRPRERRLPQDQRTVEVARRDGDRVHDRAVEPRRGRGGNDAPDKAPAEAGDKRPHLRSGWPKALAEAVRSGLA